jgi:acetyl-CoA carboxylase carboxyltransferase component
VSRLALVPAPDGKLAPLERLEALCDPGSLQLVRGAVLSRRMGDRARAGDGVLGATGRVAAATRRR